MATIAGNNTAEPITFSIVDINSNSFTIDLAGYGQVELKPVTEAEIKAYAEELATAAAAEGEKLLKEIGEAGKALEVEITAGIEQLSAQLEKASTEFNNMPEDTVIYWDGTLSDGSSVTYMNNPNDGKAFLCVVKKDLSGGALWYGKYNASQDGKIMTITDESNGSTVTYEITKTTPNTAMKISVQGFGEGNLKAVMKGCLISANDPRSQDSQQERAALALCLRCTPS